MKACECSYGRVFVLRLEDGDRIPDAIEDFAKSNNIQKAVVTLVGGVGGGKIVVGPEARGDDKVVPMVHPLLGIHEIHGVGTIFANEEGTPVLHMHASMGREGVTLTGCVRTGLDVWLVGEVVIMELVGPEIIRKKQPETGFELLTLS